MKKVKETIVRLNTVIMTKVKLQSVNHVNITSRGINKWSGDTIRLGDVYIYYVTHDEILETIFLREYLNDKKLILEGEVESTDNESECNEINFPT